MADTSIARIILAHTSKDGLVQAVLQTVVYADIFDYPLSVEEIHRYLHGVKTTLHEVQECIAQSMLDQNVLVQKDGLYTLPGRQNIIQTRLSRQKTAGKLWSKAQRYAKIIARLPFVRMVAVTGALAMDNEENNDIDFLIITKPDRLWLCRGLVILVVRWAALHGDLVCPNYLLSESVLEFSRSDLYAAHEIAQMVPLSGMSVYEKIRSINRWVDDFLPNATGLPRRDVAPVKIDENYWLRRLVECILFSKLGAWIETWEMQRKIQKFSRQFPTSQEADFCPEWCKGHFGEYGQYAMRAYDERVRVINE